MGMTCSLQRVRENELDKLLRNPAHFPEFDERKVPASHLCDIDKAWHGLHFLFTGTAFEGKEPFCFLLCGGAPLMNEETETTAIALRPTQVNAFADAISQFSEQELRSRFAPAVMMSQDIYPAIWDRDPREDDTFGYLLENFHILRKFLHIAAAENDAILVSIG
jgi:hypothetical protein